MLLKKRFLFFAVLALLICVGQATAGPNANAVVSLDLIADGGAGNQTDDGVTSGTASGQGTKIVVEVFAKGVETSLLAVSVNFNFDSSVLKLVGGDSFDSTKLGFATPINVIDPNGCTFLTLSGYGVTLPPSGYIGYVEFSTAMDVTGKEFSLGLTSAVLAAGPNQQDQDEITSSSKIEFNRENQNTAANADFDGSGVVDIADFLQFVDAYGTTNEKYDLDGSGTVDIADFLAFVDVFGQTVQTTPIDSVEGDRAALVALYNATGGNNWKHNTNWLSDQPLGQWDGVITNAQGRVSSLTLSLNNLTGSIPPELGNLTKLEGLDLSINNLSGSIPSELGNLTNLRILVLNSNQLTGAVPSELGNLSNLVALLLEGNSGLCIPAFLQNWLWSRQVESDAFNDFPICPSSGDGATVTIVDANLRAVIETALEKAIGAKITRGDMSTLTYLEARNKNIRDLTGLEYATNLQNLDLGSERVSGSGYVNSNAISDFSTLSSLTNLTWLDLDSNGISNLSALVSAISGLPSLQTLVLSNNSISDISSLSSLINLTSLNLGGDLYSYSSVKINLRLDSNAISDVSALSSLINLTSLNLSGNDISDFSPLSSLTKLTDLTLINTKISNLSSLSSLTGLTHLNLAGNTLSDLSPLRNLTNLTSLDLLVTTISDVSALSGLTSLTYLDLSHNSISDISALSGLTSLTRLDLVDTSISDISALSGLTSLTILHLQHTSISDISALSGLTSLTILYLADTSISDISALSGLTSLTRLNLFHNSISDVSALSGLTSLTILHLDNNRISNLAPLVANTGLGSGDEVDVRRNPLSDTSLNTHIPALQGRGVTVQFGSSKPTVGETEQRMPREVMKRFKGAGWEKEGDSFDQ